MLFKGQIQNATMFAVTFCAWLQTPKALAEDLETHSLKINGGIKQADSDVGTLKAQVVDVKAYQNYDRYLTWGFGFRHYDYDKDGKITGGEGSDLSLDVLLNTPKLYFVGINLFGYGKAAQALYSDHSYNVATSFDLNYDSVDFKRRSTTLSLGMSIGPRSAYIYHYAITAECGFAWENLTNRKAFAGGNEDKLSKPGDKSTTGTEFLVGLQLTH
jgi:hypothetical protein